MRSTEAPSILKKGKGGKRFQGIQEVESNFCKRHNSKWNRVSTLIIS